MTPQKTKKCSARFSEQEWGTVEHLVNYEVFDRTLPRKPIFAEGFYDQQKGHKSVARMICSAPQPAAILGERPSSDAADKVCEHADHGVPVAEDTAIHRQ